MAKKKQAVTDDKARKLSALEAQIRQLRGEKLTRQHLRDLAWFEHLERRRYIEEWQSAIPKGEYCQLASRQHKLINDAAETYELPIGDAEVDLKAALTALHNFIAANAHRLRAPDGDSAELRDEKLREEILKLRKENERADIELLFKRGEAIGRDQVRDALVALSARLRTFGQVLAGRDSEARAAFNDFLESTAAEIESGSLSF